MLASVTVAEMGKNGMACPVNISAVGIIADQQDHTLITAACRNVIKGGNKMTKKEIKKLELIHDALDEAMGDSDPIGDMTDNEIRDQDPLFWATMKLAELILKKGG
jgi:hypothetical protein